MRTLFCMGNSKARADVLADHRGLHVSCTVDVRAAHASKTRTAYLLREGRAQGW